MKLKLKETSSEFSVKTYREHPEDKHLIQDFVEYFSNEKDAINYANNSLTKSAKAEVFSPEGDLIKEFKKEGFQEADAPKITALSIAQFEADRLKGEAKEIDDSHAVLKFKFNDKFYNVDIRLKELGDLTESDNSSLADSIVEFMYNNFPKASYTGDGKLGDRLVLYFDNFPPEAIDALFKEFGNKVTVREAHSEYAPEIKHTVVIINNDVYEEAESASLEDIVSASTADGKFPPTISYKGNTYREYQVIDFDNPEVSNVYYCNMDNVSTGDPEDSDDYFIVKALLNKVEHGYKGIKDIYSIEDFTSNGIEETEGTQVDDIAKKEDYPQFKLGKKITNMITPLNKTVKRKELTEDEVLDALEPEEKQKAVDLYNDRIIKGYRCKNCNKEIKNITDFKRKSFKDRNGYYCPYCGEPYDFEDLKDIELKESYNYIGTDVDEEPRDNNSHKEKIFTVCDQYGEIGVYHTREEAQKVIDEWYNDPELYGEEGPQLRIEEDIVDVSNNKIVVPDDLAN